MSRRRFLQDAAQLAALTSLPRLTLARTEGQERLVFVILRGALDGLAAVPAYAEPRYARLRGELALGAPGLEDGVLKLDGTFALHPILKNMHAMYTGGELAVVHAVATPYRERSHFDGQDVLENGGYTAGWPHDGWLNRAVAALSLDGPQAALALAQNVPLVLRGEASVSSYAPTRLPEASDDTFERIADLYSEDSHLSMRLEEALAARTMTENVTGGAGMALASQQRLGALMGITARYLTAEDGPRIAVLETGGWDTHANQGAAQGALANRLRLLDTGLTNLKRELGAQWSRTLIIVATEFGRTVATNGTRGTDHGTGTCAFLAGGGMNGGRVIADWPGLGTRDLYEGRDLKPTLDLRAVFKGVLRDHMRIDEGRLATTVFPDSRAVHGIEGLVKAA